MSQSINAPIIINDLAEGSPNPNETREPVNPAKTTTLPAVGSKREETPVSAETGMNTALSAQAEGKDKDEAQDASRTADETKPAPEKAPVVMFNKPRSVLIVEDTVELGEVIQGTLERMNLVTAHETQGSKAIAKYTEMQPDVVLLDISLPDTTGWKILEHIKAEQEKSGRSPVVIVITAYGDPANRLIGKLQGVHSYLVKPFTPDEIETTVIQALSSAAR
ncbi:MAG: response regulator [Chloroflexi bacterium]|nr:response regulator [Chloroflexota bacterium]